MMRSKLFLCSSHCWFIFGICLLAGCGGESRSPVSGKVINGDKPLTTGTVTFHPDAAKGNTTTLHPSSEISADGSYILKSDGEEGAPVGWYKVTVLAEAARPADGKDAYAILKPLVGQQYTSEQETPLSIEVKDDAPAGHYEIKLDPRK